MKKEIIGLSILVCTLLLTGCGREAEPPTQVSPDYNNNAGGIDGTIPNVPAEPALSHSTEPEEEEQVLTLRIVDGAEDGSLLLAGEGMDSVYRVSLRSARGGEGTASSDVSVIPVYLDGQPADAADLEDGMMVEIVFRGGVMESFPARIGQICSVSAYSLGTEQNPGGGYYDLCGFYLQVLDDLWEKDSGLNGGVDCVSVDLSEAPGGLTEGEKFAVVWRFAELHQVEGLMFSYEELLQEGYLTAVDSGGGQALYQWEDGLLFTISAGEWEEKEIYSLPVLKFDAGKWRSPLGAYFFSNCFAVWPEMGAWSGYSVEAEVIS